MGSPGNQGLARGLPWAFIRKRLIKLESRAKKLRKEGTVAK